MRNNSKEPIPRNKEANAANSVPGKKNHWFFKNKFTHLSQERIRICCAHCFNNEEVVITNCFHANDQCNFVQNGCTDVGNLWMVKPSKSVSERMCISR